MIQDPNAAKRDNNMNSSKIAIGVLFIASGTISAADWTRFRGPNGTGIADDKNIPAKWTVDSILFKVEIPGKGHSSPIVSKGKVFLQSASTDTKERYLLCLDAISGKILWTKT